jgi:hypothetical protein
MGHPHRSVLSFGGTIPALEKHGRAIESLLLAGSSLVVWCALGPVRWGTRPWSLDVPYAEKQPIYQALLHADIGAKVLAGLAVALALVAFQKNRTRFEKVALIAAMVALLVSFVP